MTESRPRFLAPAARVGDGHGYVDRPEQAMTDEPECIGPAIVDAYADLNATYDRLRHAKQVEEMREARKALTVEQRMADARRRAKLARLDLSSEFHVMRKMIERGKGPAALRRLEAAEERLDNPRMEAA